MGLFRSLSVVSFFTLLSRVLGLAREMILASKFGATASTDALFVAFRIPNLLRRLFAEGAFAQAFVPILTQFKEKEGEERAKLLIAHIASILSIALLLISIAGVVFAPYLIYVVATGFSESSGQAQLTTDLLRLTFPYILFISLTSFGTSILNTWGRFAVPALTPALLNVSFILCALYLTPYVNPPIIALGVAIIIGGVAQLSFQIPFLIKLGLMPRLRWNPSDPGVLQTLRRMGPAIVGVSAAQISLLISTNIASRLQAGSVSWLHYADRLMELPVGLLGVAMGTVILPALSVSVAKEDTGDYEKTLGWGIRLMLVVALPSVLGLVILADPILMALFLRDEFSYEDLKMTKMAFWAYGLGLLPIIFVKLFASVFYAHQDMKTPVKMAIRAIVFTQLINLLVWFVFPYEIRHAGLALAISCGAWLNVLLLAVAMKKHGFLVPTKYWGTLAKSVLASGFMMSLVLIVSTTQINWIEETFFSRLTYLGLLILFGLTIYLFGLRLLGHKIKALIKA